MSFSYTTIDKPSEQQYVHDVLSVSHIGTHTFELYTRTGKVRVTDVLTYIMRGQCLCHHQ